MSLKGKTVNGIMLEAVARLLFPAHCVSCQAEGDWLCVECQTDLKTTPAELCRICGQFGRTGICEKCRKETSLDGIISLFGYAEPGIQRLIKTAKYAGQSDALEFFVRRYRTKLLRSLPEGEWAFGFVPLDRARRTQRGFNQAELIAGRLALREFPVASVFKKLQTTPHQAELDQKDRRANLRKVFSINEPVPTNLVICDDVITTGTTLGRLAKLAKKAGAEKVWALTLAHS